MGCSHIFLSLSSLSWGVSHSSFSMIPESLSRDIWYRNSFRSNSFQNEGGSSISFMEETLLNDASNTTWNYCEMCPVSGFKMRETSLPLLGLNPTNTPFRDRCCHLDNVFPCCKLGSRTYTGHPQMCTSFSLCLGNWVQENRSDGAIPVESGIWV